MTRLAAEDRRLIALAAVFAPARAEALVAHLASGRVELLREAASRAARRTRGERLVALRDEIVALREAAPATDPRSGRDAAGGTPRTAPLAYRRLLRERAARVPG